MNIPWFILALALLVIGVLAAYAIYLFFKLRSQNQQREKQAQELSQELAERRDHYRNSIKVICSALVEQQVSVTEAAIRISMLVSQLELNEQEKGDFQVFFKLTEATSHIPILENWKSLSKKEKQNFDIEREKLEQSFKEFIEDAARRILDGSVTAAGQGFSQGNPKTEQQEPLFYSVGNDKN